MTDTTPKIIPYAELDTGECPKGDKHHVIIALAGWSAPSWCSKCGIQAWDVPKELYEDM